MKTFIINGSHRKEAESLKTAKFIQQTLSSMLPERETYVFSLSENPLSLWDETQGGPNPDQWEEPSRHLKEADSLIVVCPEWNGMVTAGLKNFLHFCGTDLVGHKAGYIVTVSASDNGAYPVAELRMNGTKNNRLCWIPEHLIVRQVGEVFNGPEAAGKSDAYLRKRLQYGLRILDAYAKTLTPIRDGDLIDHEAFPNGM
ncbi:MAG: NAD(P)H-dependent oxidoreductase [Opitutales bacterium]|nr:NAD(P)H-dependent oxidoreductase [Opitutales bacterium]MCH8539532.1 NAD(P)H-dependent oxidoreductase [Opitutales bacterium]